MIGVVDKYRRWAAFVIGQRYRWNHIVGLDVQDNDVEFLDHLPEFGDFFHAASLDQRPAPSVDRCNEPIGSDVWALRGECYRMNRIGIELDPLLRQSRM